MLVSLQITVTNSREYRDRQTDRELLKRAKNTDLLFDENFVGVMNQFIDNDCIVPAAFPAVMLDDETEYHDSFDHQLAVFRLSDLVENCLHLQCKLNLTGSHLQQPRHSPLSCHQLNNCYYFAFLRFITSVHFLNFKSTHSWLKSRWQPMSTGQRWYPPVKKS